MLGKTGTRVNHRNVWWIRVGYHDREGKEFMTLTQVAIGEESKCQRTRVHCSKNSMRNKTKPRSFGIILVNVLGGYMIGKGGQMRRKVNLGMTEHRFA